MRKEVTKGTGSAVAQEMLWLAWKACGGPLGMGFFQDNPRATKEDVWVGMVSASDYNGFTGKMPDVGEVRSDYVFGRMMKLRFNFGSDFIEWDDYADPADRSYNAWASKFPTITKLFDAAVAALVSASFTP